MSALGLVEQIVFGGDLDGALKTALKNRRDVAAMFASQPLATLIDDIEEALKTAASVADDGLNILDNGDGGGAPAGDGGTAMAELPAEVLVEIKSNKADDQL